MKVSCSKCPAQYEIPDAKIAGKRAQIKCRHCGARIVVDGSSVRSSTPAPPPPVKARPGPAPRPAAAKPAGARAAQPKPAARARPAAATAAAGKTADSRAKQLPGSVAPGAHRASYRPRPEWTVAVNDQDHTEMSTRQLVELFALGTVSTNTFIWKDGMDNWRTPFQIPEIAEALGKRGFRPPADAPADHDSFDDAWGSGGDSAPNHGAAVADVPPELQSALVGTAASPAKLDKVTPSGRPLNKYVDFDEEATVAVDTNKLLEQAQEADALEAETVPPPPASDGPEVSVHDQATVARPSPLSEAGVSKLAASLDAQEADEDAATVARPSPLLEAERQRLERSLARAEEKTAHRDRNADAAQPPETPRALPWSGSLGKLGSQPPADEAAAEPSAAVDVAKNVDIEPTADEAEATSPAADGSTTADTQPPSRAAPGQQAYRDDTDSAPERSVDESEAMAPDAAEGIAAQVQVSGAADAPPGPPERKSSGGLVVGLLVVLLLLGAGAAAIFVFKPDLAEKALSLVKGNAALDTQPSIPTADAPIPSAAPTASGAKADSPGSEDEASPASSADALGAEQTGPAEGPAFDGAEAQRVLMLGAGRAAACRRAGVRATTGTAEVTFAPNGKVQSLQLKGDVATSAVADCVKAAFRNIKVPKFGGDAITIGREVVVPSATAGRARPTPPKSEPAEPAEPAPAEPAPARPAPAPAPEAPAGETDPYG